ncbi:MAG: hypothetical protein IKY00_04575 [Clostridia bacterium]|nr:hypothetical protein [Clostridia bacterium]
MIKNRNSKIIIILFCIFIAGTGILFAALPKKDYSAYEKRYLAARPSLSVSSVADGSFSEGFEKYFADHTPFRTFFVAVNAYFELIKGNNGSNGVYLGSEGWLIAKPPERNNRLTENLKRIKNFTEKSGIPAYMISIPSKGYIYSEYLPGGSMEYRDGEYLEQINDTLGSCLKIIDIEPALQSEKSNNLLYFKTDHHWTADGAFTAYREFCKEKAFSIPSESDYNVREIPDFYGTSYSYSCYMLTKPDTLRIYDSKSIDKIKVEITEGKEKKSYSSMIFEERLKEEDKYTAFLDGNHSMVTIETEKSGGNLLVIQDSFAHCLVPFVAENYGKIVMIDLRYYKNDLSELIAKENIDEMIFIYGTENLATSRDIVF